MGQQVPFRFGLDDGCQCIRDRFAAKCLLSRQQLKEDAPERPNISALIYGLPARLLGAHVRRGAENCPGTRGRGAEGWRLAKIRLGDLRFPSLRKTEIQHFNGALDCDLDVLGLQVAVDDAFLVRRFEAFGDLPREFQSFFHGKRATPKPLGERDALDQLHHQPGCPISVLEAMD